MNHTVIKPQSRKPYDLVIVQHEDYAHIGQVISMPIGDGTIQVRMVPDDPCTTVNIALDKLRNPDGKYKWVHYAKVSGQFDFPVDMLRYDFAAPVNFTIGEGELGQITTQFRSTPGLPEWKDLIIARCTRTKQTQWTPARWASFSWQIEEIKTAKIEGK